MVHDDLHPSTTQQNTIPPYTVDQGDMKDTTTFQCDVRVHQPDHRLIDCLVLSGPWLDEAISIPYRVPALHRFYTATLHYQA